MLLSEAMRLGSMVTKKVERTYLDGDGGACAMGAAGIAVGCLKNDHYDLRDASYDILRKQWPWEYSFTQERIPCPVEGCEEVFPSIDYGVTHLNDSHLDWTRENIADWVAEQEKILLPETTDGINVGSPAKAVETA